MVVMHSMYLVAKDDDRHMFSVNNKTSSRRLEDTFGAAIAKKSADEKIKAYIQDRTAEQ